MCGICGIITTTNDASFDIFDSLLSLQHRGQDACGIATSDEVEYNLRKGNGLLRDVFDDEKLKRMTGYMSIGHNRYPTAGGNCPKEAQPIFVNNPYGILLCHNGNLVNIHTLEKRLHENNIHINSNSDSEILLNILSLELNNEIKNNSGNLNENIIFSAMTNLFKQCVGGYAVIFMIINFGIIAFRDPNGIRPLIYGSRIKNNITEYLFGSESVCLDCLDFNLIDDVKPGEVIIVNKKYQLTKKICCNNTTLTPCIFEYVYLARPDSIMNGISVYNARLNMGKVLAMEIIDAGIVDDIDVIIPVPDTSRTYALQISGILNKQYREGLIKNRYIDRTFIMPGQDIRKKSIKRKLNVIKSVVNNKNLLIVDDSIVRGNTSKYIIKMLRNAGANKIFLASGAPPVKYQNIYGIDIPSQTELIAYDKTIKEIEKIINVDKLIYPKLDKFKKSLIIENKHINNFECCVFDNIYITKSSVEYLKKWEKKRLSKSHSYPILKNDIIVI